MDLLERDKKQDARDPRTHSCLRDGEIRRLEQDPYDRHDQTVGHEDDDRVEQIPRECHRNRTHDQKDEQHNLKYFHMQTSYPIPLTAHSPRRPQPVRFRSDRTPCRAPRWSPPRSAPAYGMPQGRRTTGTRPQEPS